MYTMFWQALSASELGNTIVRAAGRPVVDTAVAAGQTAVRINQPQVALEPALRAFRAARSLLSRHMSGQAPVPVARAGKQATFRSFSTNAIQAAALSQSVSDILGEVEVAESTVGAVTGLGGRDVGRRGDELRFARGVPPPRTPARCRCFDAEYDAGQLRRVLSDTVAHSAGRRASLKMVGAITGPVAQALSPDLIVQRALNLKLPRTVFLLFHVGERMSRVVILDLESSTVAPFAAKFGERDLRTIHGGDMATASNPETRRLALDALGTRYNELLGPVLERLLPFLPGRRLKIFPRLQMNGAALHALRFEGKSLLEHCDAISSARRLACSSRMHASRTAPPPPVHAPALRMVMGDDVGWCRADSARVRTAYGESCVVDQAGSWPQLVDSLRRTPARDTVFACHGEFDPDNLDGSWLRLARGREDGQVLLFRVFADLDLSSCRSVMMGACDSGLARAEVGEVNRPAERDAVVGRPGSGGRALDNSGSWQLRSSWITT